MEENEKEMAFDMNKLTIRIHNKIAIWNNADVSSEEKAITLKVLSHDIVTDVISTAFSGLQGVKTKVKVIESEPIKKESKLKKMFRKKNN